MARYLRLPWLDHQCLGHVERRRGVLYRAVHNWRGEADRFAEPFTEYTEADYAAMLAVNLTGFFHFTQLAVAEMEKQRKGHVVQITTSLVDHANSSVPSVLASLTKGGLSAATKSLAIEYAARGIRVNAVSPGVINSPMQAAGCPEFLGALHPMGHMGEISDIVDAVLYLESAPFVTGEILHVDGGQSAGH
ncbi:MAG TPA: SDR family oxidoreductase [Acetobacteraceae bacterium]|nr:SDR family oxidoreductase [Acetobacteraceae bacterium]